MVPNHLLPHRTEQQRAEKNSAKWQRDLLIEGRCVSAGIDAGISQLGSCRPISRTCSNSGFAEDRNVGMNRLGKKSYQREMLNRFVKDLYKQYSRSYGQMKPLSLFLAMVSFCELSMFCRGASNCPTVSPRSRAEVIQMGTSRSHEGCWSRDQDGTLVFISAKRPDQSYEPIQIPDSSVNLAALPADFLKLRGNPLSKNRDLAGEWLVDSIRFLPYNGGPSDPDRSRFSIVRIGPAINGVPARYRLSSVHCLSTFGYLPTCGEVEQSYRDPKLMNGEIIEKSLGRYVWQLDGVAPVELAVDGDTLLVTIPNREGEKDQMQGRRESSVKR